MTHVDAWSPLVDSPQLYLDSAEKGSRSPSCAGPRDHPIDACRLIRAALDTRPGWPSAAGADLLVFLHRNKSYMMRRSRNRYRIQTLIASTDLACHRFSLENLLSQGAESWYCSFPGLSMSWPAL